MLGSPLKFNFFSRVWDIELISPPIVHNNFEVSKHSVLIGAL